MLILTVIQGPDKGRTFELPDDEPQLLGRSSEALPLTDTTVSRRHAELTPDDGLWWIRDMGSQNGTWVNGVRLSERTRLKPGDQIRTGATLLVFGTTDRAAGSGTGVPRLRLLRPEQVDTAVERTLPSNDDSVIMAEPEPRQSAIDHLRVIYRLTTLTSRPGEQRELLEAVMDLVFSEFRPERGFIVLVEPEDDDEATDGADAGRAVVLETGRESPEGGMGAGSGSGSGGQRPRRPVLQAEPAVVRYAEGLDVRRDERLAVSRTILQHAINKGEGVLSSNAMTDPRFRAGDSVVRLSIRSAVCSPIRFRDRCFGAIYIDSSIANYTFTAEQLALLNAIGQHSGLALANARLYAEKLRGERLAAMGETVASLSHSIKNILQGLRGGADVVEMGLKKEDLRVARGGWGILKRNLDRIISLTMNMLAYSRPRTLEIELTPLAPLLEDCAALLADQCQAKGVALIIDAEHDMPPVPVDPGQLHQALMNLLSNAVEAVDARIGVVTVRVQYRQGAAASGGGGGGGGGGAGGPAGARAEVLIDVIDNGPGIAPEKAARVFEPFFTTKGLRGTGLGLAVTKRIVEQHGGSIRVRASSRAGASTGVPGAGAGGGAGGSTATTATGGGAGPGGGGLGVAGSGSPGGSRLGTGATFSITLPVDSGTLIDPAETAQPKDTLGD